MYDELLFGKEPEELREQQSERAPASQPGRRRKSARRPATALSMAAEVAEPRLMLTPTIVLPSGPVIVAEDVTGTSGAGDPAIATFTVTDAMSVSITDGDPNGHFYIDYDQVATATLRVSQSAPLDYNAQSSFSLTVVANDGRGGQASDMLAIQVTQASSAAQTYTMSAEVDVDRDGQVDAIDVDEDLYLAVNEDDDDGNSMPDLNESPAGPGEDDLVAVRLTIDSNLPFNGHGLTVETTRIKVWADPQKSTEITDESPLLLDSQGSQTIVVDLYVEGLEEGDGEVQVFISDPGAVGENVAKELAGELKWALLNPTKAIWLVKIIKQRNRHKNYLYYEPTGIKAFFERLEARAKTLTIIDSPIPVTPKYVPFLSAVVVSDLAAVDELTAVHETVHAIDHAEPWYLSSTTILEEEAEALAWGAEAILNATGQLRSFEDGVRNGTITEENVMSRWQNVIASINNILDDDITWDGGTQSRKIVPADLQDIKAKLGLRFEFSVLIPKYQQLLNDHDVNAVLTTQVEDTSVAAPFQ